MFHYKLLELESQLMAKELAGREAVLSEDCESLVHFIEAQIGMKLASPAQKDWRGWICYRRQKNSLVVVRGKAFRQSGIFANYLAGLDVPYGLDTITEYQRGFDISPPQELDHLLINFRLTDPPHVLILYGENISPYQLYFEDEAICHNQEKLKDAIAEGCIWILSKPKEMTLSQYLAKKN